MLQFHTKMLVGYLAAAGGAVAHTRNQQLKKVKFGVVPIWVEIWRLSAWILYDLH